MPCPICAVIVCLCLQVTPGEIHLLGGTDREHARDSIRVHLRSPHVIHFATKRCAAETDGCFASHLHRGGAQHSAFGYRQYKIGNDISVSCCGSDIGCTDSRAVIANHGRKRRSCGGAIVEGDYEVKEGGILRERERLGAEGRCALEVAVLLVQ